MNLMKKFLHSKWTSIEKLNGWRHFEVKNVFVKNKELEIFSVCDKNILERIGIEEIENKMKWLPGWQEII
jgi:tryptophan-rich hypothetical protein